MTKPPSLLSLCMDSIKSQLLFEGDDTIAVIYELPSELFDCLLPRLPPLALHKLQQQMPVDFLNGYEPVPNQRKRKRDANLNFETWKALYMYRWPACGQQNHEVDWLVKDGKAKNELTNDWHQFYWETHLQNCLDAAAEIALLPSHDGCIGDIKVPDTILEYIGGKGHQIESMNDYTKLSYHCHKFGLYARCLRLRNVLCMAEICDLFKSIKLESLELHWIKSEHVQGLCELLCQNNGTLRSIKFVHCKLSPSLVNTICKSLFIEGIQTFGIQHFSIKTSSIVERNASTIPVGFTSFLSSVRYLSSLCLCDNQLQKHFARMILDTLLDASSSITILDLSENNISGWLSHFKWRHSTSTELHSGIGKSLQCLSVLNLRNNNLQKEDVDCLKYALVHMPNLEVIDLSDNPIEDDGVKSLTSLFVEMSERHFHIVDLRLANCELSCNGATQLLEVLSTLKRPLKSLSIGGNDLGNKIGASLGKLLCSGISSLDVEDIGLGSSGFLEAQKEITENLKVFYINISKNRGGIEVAKFLSKVIAEAPELVSINASYNFMPGDALPVICSCLKFATEKLEHLDLTGNTFGDACVDTSLLSEFQINGKLIVKLPSTPILNAPYDDDP